MQAGTIVSRISERVDTAGEIIAIIGDKATVKWAGANGLTTTLKLSSLQPYVERTEREKILDQIEKNKRQMNRRGCTPRLIAYLRKENTRLQAELQ